MLKWEHHHSFPVLKGQLHHERKVSPHGEPHGENKGQSVQDAP